MGPIALLGLLLLLPRSTTSFTDSRPLALPRRYHARVAASVDDFTERSLLLDEIEDLARSFETVQRTIEINKEVYEEKMGALSSQIAALRSERDELRVEVEKLREGLAREEAEWGEEREGLLAERDDLRRQLVDAKAETERERDGLRAELKKNEDQIAALESALEETERERDEMGVTMEAMNDAGPSDEGPSPDDERNSLVREKIDLTDEMIRNKMSLAAEKSKMQADFGSFLREKEATIDAMQEKIDAYEKERSSLRKLSVLGLKRFASYFRPGRTEDKAE